jgi:competence protein ComEC
VLALGYALFSGWGIPAQRTVIMLAVVMGLRLLGRRWPWPVVGLWAMAVVLAWDPWAWLQAGFWLSFVAVGVLLALGNAPSDPPRPWWGLLRTQAAISVVLAPLTLVLFGQVSVVGLLANLVAIPVVTWLITPLALAGVAWHALWVPAAALVQVLMGALHAMAAWPGASLVLPALPGWLPVAAVLGGLALVWRWPLPWRALGLALWCPLLLWQASRPPVGEFEVLAADVGQGSAVVIRTAHGSVLYDAGPQWGPGSDAGQRVLLPLLHRLGERPAAVVLSHRDGDHVGGALAVLDALGQASPVGGRDRPPVVWASFEPPALVSGLSDPELARRVLKRLPDWTRCQAGQRWEQDGVVFELLHPAPALYDQATGSNNLSCVLWVRGATRSALLTGDMDAAHEAALVQAHPGLRADWLLAPHHGSRTSSSAELLATVRPQWVVVQAGYLSRYGHPAPQVLARYRAHGVRWAATPDCGAALWRSTSPQTLVCQRQAQPRHWHWRSAIDPLTPLWGERPGPEPDPSGTLENP